MSDRRVLGKYQLIAELARGGMGVVYLAITSGLGGFSKLLVVKELRPELVEDPGFLAMFLEEARLAARLNHPNIVPTYEVGMDDNRPFIVMDFLEGQTLARVLRKRLTGFTREMHVRVITDALEGLKYAHHREDFDGTVMSVVHRDVSPQNVFVTYDGQVKVVDFGIAKASDTTLETRTGLFKGKPAYMAPEQVHGEVDPRADVYAVGVMLWEAVAGQRMWSKKNDIEVLTSLLKGAIPSIDEAAPDAPEELRRIVRKAVALSRDDRYQSARALRDDLDAYLDAAGDRTSLRDVGAVVSEAFSEHRQKLRALIERCIAESKSSAPMSRSQLPTISAAPEESSLQSGPSSASRSPYAEPRLDTKPSVYNSATPAVSTVDYPGTPPAKRISAFIVAAGALAFVAAVAFIVVQLLGPKSREPAAESSVSSVAPQTAPAAPAPPTASEGNGLVAAPVVSNATPPSALAAPQESSSAIKPPPVATRIVYVHTPAPPKPAAPPKGTAMQPASPALAPANANASTTPTSNPTAAVTSAPPPPKPDCNPPFYFEGTKKVFKPACL